MDKYKLTQELYFLFPQFAIAATKKNGKNLILQLLFPDKPCIVKKYNKNTTKTTGCSPYENFYSQTGRNLSHCRKCFR